MSSCMAQASTSVRLRPETADALHDRKQRGDSYDDVIQRLLRETAEGDAEGVAQED